MLRRNVLIFHQGALGDFVLTWPFAIALGRVYAQSRIVYVTHHQKGKLAEKVLRLESNDVENGWHSLFADDAKLPEQAARLLGGAHAVYSFQSSSSSQWIANVRQINPAAKVLAIDPRPAESFDGHITQWILNQLQDHPIERAAMEQMLRSISDRGVGFNRAGGADVLIHPGSGSPGKCWSLDRFIELAWRFRDSGRSVRFVTGEVECERWAPADFDRLAEAGDIRRPQSYLDLLAEISAAALFVGNDSGPGHLAGIIGTPTVSLFVGTDPARWQPLGPRVKVVMLGEKAPVDEMWEAARKG